MLSFKLAIVLIAAYSNGGLEDVTPTSCLQGIFLPLRASKPSREDKYLGHPRSTLLSPLSLFRHSVKNKAWASWSDSTSADALKSATHHDKDCSPQISSPILIRRARGCPPDREMAFRLS